MNRVYSLLLLKIIMFTFLEVNASWNEHEPFVMHTIPKCGCHFSYRTIYLLTNSKLKPAHREISAIQAVLNQNAIPHVVGAYKKEVDRYLTTNGIKMLTFIRDPRDALISHLFYMRSFFEKDPNVGTRRDFFLVSSDFDSLSFDDQLTALIKGRMGMQSYVDFYIERIYWSLRPRSLAIKYEDLVGENGGGNNEKQIDSLKKIAAFIGYPLSQEKLDFLVENLHQKEADRKQGSRTFVRATQGNWKTFFKPKHKLYFKQRIKDFLIKLGYEKDHNW